PAPSSAGVAETTPSLQSTLPSSVKTSHSLNTAMLIADPIANHPELRWLQERRNWAARHATTAKQLAEVANEFAAKEAWYPAIEMLWLADKLSNDPAQRKQFTAQMVAWQQKKKPVEDDVNTAEQMWGGGKPKEALDQLSAIIKAHPYSELAYLKIGYLYLQTYRGEEGKSEKLIEPVLRAQVFRAC